MGDLLSHWWEWSSATLYLSQLLLSLKISSGYFQLKLEKCSSCATGSMNSDKGEEKEPLLMLLYLVPCKKVAW